jgi:peptide-methionine (R)-S-oxide reductase
MQFYVTQNHGTEPPFTGRLLHNKRDGVYHCLVCDAPLFHSQTKYDSGCGWPSFYEPVSEEAIRYLNDDSTGCNALKFAAEIAMRIWGMCFRMDRSRPGSVFASIRPH